MGGTGVTRRPLEWVLLLLGWVAIAGPSGFVMYVVTAFLFAFSGGQYRMSPVVGAAPWVVSIGALLVGGGVLAASRSLPRALWAVVRSIAVAWPVAVLVLWLVSFRLGSGSPCEPGQPCATIPPPVSGRDMARGQHTATLLADGRVLVAGGTGAGDYLATAALYDPSTGAWMPTGPLGVARADHTAIRLADGRVLIVGGAARAGVPAGEELYDPATGRWAATGDPGTPRVGHAAAALPDGRVLVVGGRSRAVAEVYDPATDAWSPTATTLRHGRVLVSGGVREGRGGTARPAELYDPVAGTWAATGTPRSPQLESRAIPLADGTVLVVGVGGPGEATAAEIYDPATGAWSSAGDPGRGRHRFAIAALPGGRVLLAGGVAAAGPGRGEEVTPASEVYDPRTGATTPAAGLGTARTGHTLTALADGAVLAVGGYGPSGPTATAERFDPATGAWAPAGTMDAR